MQLGILCSEQLYVHETAMNGNCEKLLRSFPEKFPHTEFLSENCDDEKMFSYLLYSWQKVLMEAICRILSLSPTLLLRIKSLLMHCYSTFKSSFQWV
jgi:hypothetical protein